MKKAEEELEVKEAKLEELKAELLKPEYQSSYSKLTEIQNEIDAMEEEIMEDMENWEALSQELEALEAFLDKAESIWKPSVLSLGGGTFCFPASRSVLLERAECVYLKASLEDIRSHVGDNDASRPLFKDADRLFAVREPIYSLAPLTVDTSGKSVREVAEQIRDILFA